MDAYLSEQTVTWVKLIGRAIWLEKEATRLGRHDDAAKFRKAIDQDSIRLLVVISSALMEYSRGPKRKVTP